jgi:hypothetical protein
LARLQRSKRKALEQKQTVDWQAVNRDWDDYFQSGAAGDNWREEFLPVIEGVILDQGNAWNVAFGMQFNVRNLFAEEWFEDYLIKFAQDIDRTTNDNLTEMLQQAMREGWTVDQMRKQIDLQFDQYIEGNQVNCSSEDLTQTGQWFCDRQPRFRREMIARTETIKASNAGSIALFRDWGVVEGKEWLATGDDRTRDSHLVAWANYSEGGSPGPIPLEASFSIGGSSLMFPGDPRGAPSETVNCRCTVLPFFSEAAGTAEQIAQQQAIIAEEQERRRSLTTVAIGRAPTGSDMTTGILDQWLAGGVDWRNATEAQRAEIKNELIEALASRSGASYEDVNRFVKQWSISSNDFDMRSLAIQQDAAKQFNIPLSEFSTGKINELQAQFDEFLEIMPREAVLETVPQFSSLLSSAEQMRILDSMHSYTQEQLAEAGFGPGDIIRLRRGVGLPDDVIQNWSVGDETNVVGNVLESWSVGKDIAEDFARRSGRKRGQTGIVFEMDVPIELIVGTARTGFGALTEGEFVIQGIQGTGRVVNMFGGR